MNPVRDLLKAGQTVVGTAGSLYEDNMALLADSGLDFILFDSQHAPVEVKQYHRAIQAMRGKKAAPIVRVSANRADVICFALDLGARGIIVPMVNTKQEAEAVDVLPGLKAGASTPPDGSAVAPAGPRPFLPALNGGVPRAFLMG